MRRRESVDVGKVTVGKKRVADIAHRERGVEVRQSLGAGTLPPFLGCGDSSIVSFHGAVLSIKNTKHVMDAQSVGFLRRGAEC